MRLADPTMDFLQEVMSSGAIRLTLRFASTAKVPAKRELE